jgi:hypothetical protein
MSAKLLLVITTINKVTHKISGAFSGSIYKDGYFTDSTMNVENDAFYATYSTP